jgi:hypothetical protein
MMPSDETLMAYVDGELDEQAREEVEAAVLADPDIAARLARQQALRKRVRLAFARVLEEPVPDRLVATARAHSEPQRPSNVVPLRRKESRKWSWPEWSAMAASVAAGAVLSLLFVRSSNMEPIMSGPGGLFATGRLAQALSDQLASAPDSRVEGAGVQIGVSFRDKNGDYCRTFSVHDSSALAGLACHSGERWRLDVLARAAGGADTSTTQYRPAASSLPRPILQSVEERIAGEPLDARAEAAAKAAGWKAAPH